MTRITRVLSTVAAAAALTAVALPATATAAVTPQATCSSLEVVFARGSGELPGLGVVGTPLVSGVQSAVGSSSVSSYAVNYAASYDQTSAGPGATDMSNHITTTAAQCPNTKFAIGGYSQGASVTDIAIGIRTVLGTGQTIPTNLASRVVAVVAFGNPLGLSGQTIKTASPTYGPKSLEFCNLGDPVCGGTGTGPGYGHLSYPTDGSVTTAAKFIAQQYNAS
ncbi:cutinase [Amycolatopsis bartoniae]|uniref:Cutinase n=1 Tax=Amycolatopsis bartoniae TaxID=941986 RepID=A0A8H9J1S6_9PSEU|nr:cutinase family protein [Amycolatopsis bartoniae]MBB2937414.1 cutinase [Amycolatopsis bartoniae]TVS99672.1 cutinase family protein [Amycolatopsis bartoniae]GHF86619.1 cutinase [Amycolatopsis bartoniae]